MRARLRLMTIPSRSELVRPYGQQAPMEFFIRVSVMPEVSALGSFIRMEQLLLPKDVTSTITGTALR